jgi:ATP-dependent DNA ligase
VVRMRALLRANLDRQGTWLSATGVVNGRVPGSAEASMAEVSEPSLLLTLRWREMDSNYWSRHGETPLGRAMWFPRTAPRARRSADPERDEEFESISLQQRVC